MFRDVLQLCHDTNKKGFVYLMEKKNQTDYLKHDLKVRGITIPIIFALVVVAACVIISTSHLNIFPSGNHYDSLTTTVTETTEFNENEFSRVIKN